MTDSGYGQLLERKGLKKTKVRMALLQHFMKMDHAESYNDLRSALADDVDKSTLYRNLTSFEAAGIIHSINDHSGIAKYAFGASPHMGIDHAHFVCESCETVYCMEELTPHRPEVPDGFKTTKVQTIIKGICSKC